MLPFGSLAFIPLSIIAGAVLGVACLARCLFALEYAVACMLILVGLGGVMILFIKLKLGFIILTLLSIAPNRHSYPFSLPPILFLQYSSSWCPTFFADQGLLL